MKRKIVSSSGASARTFDVARLARRQIKSGYYFSRSGKYGLVSHSASQII